MAALPAVTKMLNGIMEVQSLPGGVARSLDMKSMVRDLSTLISGKKETFHAKAPAAPVRKRHSAPDATHSEGRMLLPRKAT